MVSLKNIAVAAAAIVGYVHAAPSSFRKNSNIIEDSYVIRLKPGVADFQAHTSWVTNVHKRNLAKRSGVKQYKGIEREFNFEHVKTKGYSGVFDHATIEEIRNSDAVAQVQANYRIYLDDWAEANSVSSISDTKNDDAVSWHLAAISNRDNKGSVFHHESNGGNGTWAYVVDSGIRASHSEFEDRAEAGWSGYDDDGSDPSGHGTHVAGLIAGKTCGSAPKANVVGVKVFDVIGTESAILIEGIEWAINEIKTKDRIGKAVLNLSLSGQRLDNEEDDMMLNVLKEAADDNILSIVAAGNEASPAANVTPAFSNAVFTVGAIQPDYTIWRHGSGGSNYGPEIDLMAPGAEIKSAYHHGDDSFYTTNGTSMATPLVAGLACYAMSVHGITDIVDLRKHLIDNGTPDVLGGDLRDSPDLLANNGNEVQES